MCCKLPNIDELGKKAGDWCHHCSTRSNCDIYETRPDSCRSFFCHFMENPRLGEEWRPSKSRLMILGKDDGHTVLVMVDPDRPDAWKKEPYLASFHNWSQRLNVVINVGARQYIVKDGLVQERPSSAS